MNQTLFNLSMLPQDTLMNRYTPLTDVEIIDKYCSSYDASIWSLVYAIGGTMLIRSLLMPLVERESGLYRFIDSATETILIIGIVMLCGYAIAANGLFSSLRYSIKVITVSLLFIMVIVAYRRGYMKREKIEKIMQYFKNN